MGSREQEEAGRQEEGERFQDREHADEAESSGRVQRRQTRVRQQSDASHGRKQELVRYGKRPGRRRRRRATCRRRRDTGATATSERIRKFLSRLKGGLNITMTIETMVREFRYDEIRLPDPNQIGRAHV